MTAARLGLLTTSAGIGAVFNAYLIYRLRRKLNDNQLTTLSFLLSAIIIFLIAKSTLFFFLFILMFFFGISWSIAVSVFNGMLQSDFPLVSRSRLIGLYYVFFAGSQALGSYLSGLLVVNIGLITTLNIISIVTFGVFLIYFLKPSLLWHTPTNVLD